MNTFNLIVQPANALIEEAFLVFLGLVTYQGKDPYWWNRNLSTLIEFLATKNFLDGADPTTVEAWNQLEKLVSKYKEEYYYSSSPFKTEEKTSSIFDHEGRVDSLEYRLCRHVWGVISDTKPVELEPYRVALKYLEATYEIIENYYGVAAAVSIELAIASAKDFPKLKDEMEAFEKFRYELDHTRFNIWYDTANVRRILSAVHSVCGGIRIKDCFDALVEWGENHSRSKRYHEICIKALQMSTIQASGVDIEITPPATTAEIIEFCFAESEGMKA